MKIAVVFLGWSLLIPILGVAMWQLTSDAVLRDARAPYEEKISWSTDFEQMVQEKHPDIRFTPLHDNLRFISVYRLRDYAPPFDRLPPLEFLGKLEGSETIFVYFRGHWRYEDRGKGEKAVARHYLVFDGKPLLPAYRELIPYPEGTSLVKSITLEEVVFKKDTDSAEWFRETLYMMGSLGLWAIGILLMIFRYTRGQQVATK